MNGVSINENLHDLLLQVHALGEAHPQLLIYLTTIAQPELPQSKFYTVIGDMFKTIPLFLSQANSQQLQDMIRDPPADAEPLKLLLGFRTIQQILQKMSRLQLLQLTNGAIPPGTKTHQESILKKLQELFQTWSPGTLKHYQSILNDSPLNLERQQMLQLEPELPWELTQVIIDLIKLPMDEVLSFQAWISELSTPNLKILLSLLQTETSTLCLIKNQISPANMSDLTVSTTGLAQSGQTVPNGRNGLRTASASIISSNGNLGGSSNKESGVNINKSGLGLPKKRKAEDDLRDIQDELEKIGAGEEYDEVDDNVMDISVTSPNPSSTSPSPSSSLRSSTSRLLGKSNSGVLTASTAFINSLLNSPPGSLANSSDGLLDKSVSGLMRSNQQPELNNNPKRYQIKIARQPPSQTVYQRILKPFPSVMLVAGADADTNLFVEAELIRSDTDAELQQCLDGNRIVRIANGVFAAFKKLKILSTSQQQGTLFRIKFTLKRYSGTNFENISEACIISNPIEVFSHTQYLNAKREETPPPPVITEVLPTSGPCTGGMRIVILGSNFINCPGLKVRFGTIIVPATFHEAGTLIVVTPPHKRGKVAVSVSNDGKNYCETTSAFVFEGNSSPPAVEGATPAPVFAGTV